MHNFTIETLIRYIYDETSSEQTHAIKAALNNDWSLREKLDVLIAAKTQLNTLEKSPQKQTINNIINYAKKTTATFSLSCLTNN